MVEVSIWFLTKLKMNLRGDSIMLLLVRYSKTPIMFTSETHIHVW